MEGPISVRASGPILYTLIASLNSATFVIQFDPPWRFLPFSSPSLPLRLDLFYTHSAALFMFRIIQRIGSLFH